jgi:flagellar M-ring protein FliF
MNNVFKALILQFREFYKNLTPTKRVAATVASLTIVCATIVMMVMVSGKDYQVLYYNLEPDHASTVMNKLREKNIAFRVEDNGATVLVPAQLVHTTQMALAAEMGSTKLGTPGGLELFDKQDFGATSYAQRINYQRALQGELTRAINSLDAVKQSKVILALPPKKTFLEESSKPTASVVVELHPGKMLTEDQVRGITYLVANAVEGLEADKITVVDQRGKMISKGGDAAMAGSTAVMEMKTKVERELEDKLESILSRVVGNGKVIARVNAQLSARQTNTVEEKVDGDNSAVLSQVTEEEALNGSRTNPTGIPGSRSNIPGAGDNGQVGFQQDVNKELKNINYKVPTTVRNIKEGAGGLERISVAVLVDGITVNKINDNGETIQEWAERSPAELAKYENIVKNAIGFTEGRGDSVKIENIRFQEEVFSESNKLITTLERRKLLHLTLKWAIFGFALILFFFLVVRPFMRWITDSFQDSVEEMLPRTIEELEELQSVDNSLPGMSSALPVLEESLDPDKAESELLKDRIMTLMEKDEEKSAGAFSLWLVRRDDR